jgi:hypothetical protein
MPNKRGTFRSAALLRSGFRDDTVYLIVWIGQSLATGTYATLNWGFDQGPVVTLVSRGIRCFMFRSGTRMGLTPFAANVNDVVGQAGLSTVVPVDESDDGNPVSGQSHAETMCSSLGNALYERTGKSFLFLSVAVDGTRYTSLARGTQPHTNLLTAVRAARNYFRNRGVKVVALCVCDEHGEQDQAFNSATYQADTVTWQSNIQDDLRAITGQTTPVPFYMNQQIDFTPAFTTGISTAQSQFLAHQANPYLFKLLHSKYHQQGNSDNIHRAPNVYRWAGAEYAKAIAQDSFGGVLFRPVSPSRCVISGTTVTINMYVPVPPLVFDYSSVLQNNWPMGVSAAGTSRLKMLSGTVAAGGSGYTNGATLTLSGITGTAPQFTVNVTAGAVTSINTVTVAGQATANPPANPVGSTAGAGTGATFNVTWGVESVNVTAAGNGYPAGTTVGFSGGAGSGAAATANFTGNGTMAAPTITAAGTGYTSLPTVTFTGPAGFLAGGFSFWDDSASPPTVTAATVVNQTQVQLTLSGTPSGTLASQKVRYCWGTNANNNSYSTLGPLRGNLRDSDPAIGPDAHPLWNWCAIFEMAVQNPGT